MITDKKIFFDDAFLKEIQDKFYYVHEDYLGRKRQFFENSGGSGSCTAHHRQGAL